MKRILTILAIVWLFAINSNAQQAPCHFGHLIDQQLQQNPNYANEMAQLDQQVNAYMQQNPNGGGNRAVRTVSVVVHVVYNTAAENVSTTSINNIITTLNNDFRRTNSDASQTRSAFLGVAADAQIEFCLDRILRVSTSSTCFDPNNAPNAMKSANTGGSNPIDPRFYLNVWIVDLCGNTNGGVAGYAYLPTTGVPGSSIDGLVVDYSLGYNNGFGRTTTHEIGHYFGLPHPWGSDSNPSCGVDDGFSDTPNTDGPNYACSATNSCGTPAPGDQYENFMDYSSCTNMYTTQQANYMNAVLSGVRSSLLSSPGCNSVGTAPVANFSANKTVICVGQTVNFTDASSGAPTTWAWTFAGGTPASSTVQNPTVTYNTAGTYTVTLTATNASGTDSETKVNYITVTSVGSLPVTEGFQNATFPTAGWQLLNYDNTFTWQRSATIGGYGTSTASVFVNNFDYNAAGEQDLLLLPPVSFVGVTNGRITFDYAYAQYTGTGGTASDSLLVVVSLDCGQTFFLLQKKGGTQLATRTALGTAFTPTSAQWKTDTISLSALAGEPNVQIGFLNQTGYGNNLYLDNINLSQPAVTQPPVANFVGNPTTVPVGSSVAFTDLSTNSPTGWNWSFAGGTPATSTAQNPTITYNTVGTYTVTLTASNGFGNDGETKVGYINVVQPTTGGCDTVSIFTATDSARLYYAGANPSVDGYLSGHNVYGDLAKANKYTPVVAGSSITAAAIYFGVAKTNGSGNVNVSVWDATGAGGSPGTRLTTQLVPISSIVTTGPILIPFTTPAIVTGAYFVGVEYTYASGDSIALVTNSVNSGNANFGWEKASNGTWNTYFTGWGVNLKNIIFPVECAPSGPTPVANFTGAPTAFCAGGTVTFTNTSTNATSYSWTFTGGTPSTSTAASPTVTYNTAGTYSVTLVATGANGQNTKTSTNYITVRSKPVPTATTTNVTCNGGNNGAISIAVASGTSPYTYLWNGGATTQNRTGLAAGSYTVTVTDANGCTGTTSTTVSQPPAVTLNVTSTPSNCSNNAGTATVSATGGTAPYTYLWSTGANTQAINNLGPAAYSVTVTSANGCTVIGSTVVSGSGPITVSNSTTQAGCGQSNGSATITVSGGTTPYTYAWSNGPTTQNLTGVAAGVYTVTVTSAAGCTATSTATVTNFGGATAAITNTVNVTCFGGNNGSLTVTATGGTAPLTYAWSGGGNAATKSNLTAGTYVVTVTDAGGCVTTATGTVTQPSQVVSSVSSQTNVSCFGGTNGAATVSATGGSGSYTFNWNGGFSGATRTNLAAGTYTVSAVDGAGCTAATLQVTIIQPTQLVVSTTSVNPGCTAANGSATASVSGGTTPYTYAWSNGGGSNAQATGLVAGAYTVTVTDGNGCTATSSVTLTATSGPTVTATTTPVGCGAVGNGTATAVVSAGTPPYSYLWNDAANQISQTATNLVTGNYTVTVTDVAGCSVTASATVTGLGPNVTVSQNNVTGCFGNNNGSISLNVSGGQTPYNFSWSNSQSTQNVFTLTAGSYTVTVTDNSGCATIKTIVITGPSEIQANVQVTNTTQGQNTGTATVTASGGTAPYTYAWSNGATGTSSTGLGAGNYTVAVTDANNCVRTFNFVIAVGTDVADIDSKIGVTIYPNPTNGKFVVNVSNNNSSETQIEVYNTLGQQIFVSELKMNVVSDFEIDLSHVPANTYFVKIISGDQTVVRKVLRIN